MQYSISPTGTIVSPSAKVYSRARNMERGLKELMEHNIRSEYSHSSIYDTGAKGRSAETDRLYTLKPHPEFCDSIKRSNAIQSEMRTKMQLIDLFEEDELQQVECMDDFEAKSKRTRITHRVLSMNADHSKKVLQRRTEGAGGAKGIKSQESLRYRNASYAMK